MGHLFSPKFVSILQIFEKFCNFLQFASFNFKKLGLFIKILVYSNKEYAIVTIFVINLVTSLKLRISEAKTPQNLLKDEDT